MAVLGLDYEFRIAPAALKAAGVVAVSRYFTQPSWPKSITAAEIAELRAAKIAILCNFETTADRMRGGAAAGRADAVELRRYMDDCGVPRIGVVGYFSADWDVQPSEVAAVLAYLRAAGTVLGTGLVGCYGGLRAVAAAADAGFRTWQTTAWSGGKWDPRAAMRQTGESRTVGGVRADVNQIIDLGALGAWTTEGTDMTMTPAQEKTLLDEVANLYSGLFYGGSSMGTPGLGGSNSLVAKLDALLARPAPAPVDTTALASQIVAGLVPHLPQGADPAAIAAAVVAAVQAHVPGPVDTVALAAQLTHDIGAAWAAGS